MIFSHFVGPERPLSWSFQFWPVLICSFVVALAATWLCKKIALKDTDFYKLNYYCHNTLRAFQ